MRVAFLVIVVCAGSLPAGAGEIATGSVQTSMSGMVDCAKSFTSSTGGRVDCISPGADAHAQATAAFGSLFAEALVLPAGGAHASASAGYDEMFYITGGVGAGMLMILYHVERC